MGLIHLPSKATVLLYAKSEVGLLWCSMSAATSGSSFIHLLPEQKTILHKLSNLLSSRSQNNKLEEILYKAIYSLYMPQTIVNLIKNPFQSPVTAFQALQVTKKDKTFTDIRFMDRTLNQLQFMIQLWGISYILESASGKVNYTL